MVEQLAKAEGGKDGVEDLSAPVGRQVTEAPSIRTEGDLTIIPALEEIIHVEKRLVVVEEVDIRREQRQRDGGSAGRAGRQKVVITRVPPKQSQEDIDMTFEPGAGTTARSSGNDRTFTAFFEIETTRRRRSTHCGRRASPPPHPNDRGNNPETGPEGAGNRPYQDEALRAPRQSLHADEDRYTYAEGLQRAATSSRFRRPVPTMTPTLRSSTGKGASTLTSDLHRRSAGGGLSGQGAQLRPSRQCHVARGWRMSADSVKIET